PQRFVLKPNHASGLILFCDKAQAGFDEAKIRQTLSRWMALDYGRQGREYQYSRIPRKILAEQLVTPDDGTELSDYKFFCFNGSPKFVQLDFDRFTNHTRNFYDLSWNRLP